MSSTQSALASSSAVDVTNINTGKISFEAYSKSVGGVSYDGKPIPRWDELTSPVRNAWTAGGNAVLEYVGWIYLTQGEQLRLQREREEDTKRLLTVVEARLTVHDNEVRELMASLRGDLADIKTALSRTELITGM